MVNDRLIDLLNDLVKLPKETEWVEFKANLKNNKISPEEVGNIISGLSNAAVLHGHDRAYLVFGVDDVSHEIVGTSYKPSTIKVGNEELENWLNIGLNPSTNFVIHEFDYAIGVPVAIIEVDPTVTYPVTFNKVGYIRIGSYTKPLSSNRAKEKALWAKLAEKTFESGIAMHNASPDKVLELLDFPSVFLRLGLPLPEGRDQIMTRLLQEELIAFKGGRYGITNLGAILFANDLSKFSGLSRKALRIVVYDGDNKLRTNREQRGMKGYAVGIEGAVQFIKNVTPMHEVIVGVTRQTVPMYPDLAIRELVANALIHQDFTITGTGPMIEIYDNRIEISNPGASLVDVERIIDHSPKSRNEKLAGLMARMNICEERGSGVDKAVIECEMRQLPAPSFLSVGTESTRVTLFAPRALKDMTKEDKVRATYYHAVIKYLSVGYMTNESLRDRFGIPKSNYPAASDIIRLTVDAELIKTRDADAKKYVPFWV